MKMNEVNLIGRLARDLEEKKIQTSKGSIAVCNFVLAVTRERKNLKTDEYEADFLPCVTWGKQAENLCRYQKKGNLVAVIGHVETGNYVDKNTGEKKYYVEILANKVRFLEARGKGGATKTREHVTSRYQEEEPPEPPMDDYLEDDYPEDAYPPSNERALPQDIYE